MKTILNSRPARSLAALGLAIGLAAGASAQAPAPTERLRGTVQSFDGTTLVVADRANRNVSLALADNFAVSEVVPIAIADIKPGSYVGSAAVQGEGGKLRALEVLVFPEAMRGAGEGHGPWDLAPGSTMTNATVGDVAVASDGRTLKLTYRGGEQSLVVPDNVPIVTLKPGDRSLLVPGAKVLVTAQMRDGKPTALRAAAGRNGFEPPM